MSAHRVATLLALTLCAACTGSKTPPPVVDAGADAGPALDAGSGLDAGAPVDAGPEVDAGPSDPRQALRDASLFANGSFAQADGEGRPAHWRCRCSWLDGGSVFDAGCAVVSDPGAWGGQALQIESGCYAWADARLAEDGGGLRFDLFAKGEVSATSAYLAGYYPDGGYASDYVGSTPPLLGDGGWVELASTDPLDTRGLAAARLILTGGLAQPTRFADLVSVRDVPNPDPAVGSLLLGVHREAFALSAGNSSASLYVPLPMDWAAQVPLDVELRVSPAEAVDGISYAIDSAGNLGATVHLKASAAVLELDWDAVVLTRYVDATERPQVYAEPVDAGAWLATTPVVDTSDPAIASLAGQLNAGSDAEAQMAAVIGWTSSNITYGIGPENSLSASATLHDREGSCTGFANLASALGRSLGVPTVSLANILVGDAQQIHSINEFYLGADRGWRRVEPQSPLTSVSDDYGLAMRRVLPGDEGSDALATARWWAAPGVPMRTLTELSDPGHRLWPREAAEQFVGCPECLNGARMQSHLRGDPARLASLFARARTAWQRDLSDLLAGTPDPARLQARQAFRTAQSLDDIDADLTALH